VSTAQKRRAVAWVAVKAAVTMLAAIQKNEKLSLESNFVPRRVFSR
jgi:hypothetical protein